MACLCRKWPADLAKPLRKSACLRRQAQQQGGSTSTLVVQPYGTASQSARSAVFNVSALIENAAVNSTFITNYDLFRVHSNTSDPGEQLSSCGVCRLIVGQLHARLYTFVDSINVVVLSRATAV